MLKKPFLKAWKQKLGSCIFFLILSLHPVWAMRQATLEEQTEGNQYQEPSGCCRVCIAYKSYSWIFSYCKKNDIFSFVQTAKHPKSQKAAISACSSQSLYLRHKTILEDFFSSIRKSYCREIQVLDLSYSKFSPVFLKILPKTIIVLLLNDVQSSTHAPDFTKDLIDAVFEFSNLKKLHLVHTGIGDTEVEKIAQLIQLEELDLSRNQIGPAGAQHLASMKRLLSLNLSSNQVGDQGARSIAQIQGIVSLNLSRNQIGDAGVASISGIQGIVYLNLSDNQIRDAGAGSISRMEGLRSLRLAYNQVGSCGAVSIAHMEGLSELDLSDNQIGASGAESISQMQGLVDLDLSDNRIGDAGAGRISHMEGLTSLKLAHNQIGDVVAWKLAQMKGLIELDLSDNEIGDVVGWSISEIEEQVLMREGFFSERVGCQEIPVIDVCKNANFRSYEK